MAKKKGKIVVLLMTLLLTVSFLPVMQNNAAQMYTENNGELPRAIRIRVDRRLRWN